MRPRMILGWLVIMTCLLVACGGSAPAEEEAATGGEVVLPATATIPAPLPDGELDPLAEEEVGAALSARQVLAQQLGVDLADVTIAEVEAVEWPNSCLGIEREGVACLQVITSGYRVALEVGGERYRFHTDEEGGQVVLAEAPTPEVGTPRLRWTDGSTTICQELIIGETGLAIGPCEGELAPARFVTPERAADLAAFTSRYAPFEAQTPAGNIALVGEGARVATFAEQRMIAEWARLVAQEAVAGRSGASWGLVFAYHREGGLAGFCEDVTVYVTGEVWVTSCEGGEPQELAHYRLEGDQLAQLYDWVDALAPFERGQRDAAPADQMAQYLVFSGTGDVAPAEESQQEIVAFAEALLAEALR